MRDPCFDCGLQQSLAPDAITANNTAYAEYSLSQAKKYGIKGSNARNLGGACAEICRESFPILARLGIGILDDIVARPVTANFLRKTIANSALCARCTTRACPWPSFPLLDAGMFARYGTRSMSAKEPWRAITRLFLTPLRALDQMESFSIRARFVFPEPSEKLFRSSEAKLPWPDLSSYPARLAEVDAKKCKIPCMWAFFMNEAFAKKICLTVMDAEKPGGHYPATWRNEIRKNFLRWEHGHNLKNRLRTKPEAGQ